MLLYKFRSLANFEFTADILVKERLYCAEYHALNDPFEGQFLVSRLKYEPGANWYEEPGDPVEEPGTSEELATFFPNGVPRICSLSSEADDVRMWSYYGDSHKGIAIILELEPSKSLQEVKYEPVLHKVDERILGLDSLDPATWILLQKTREWSFEKEWRVFSDAPFLDVSGKIEGIVLGCRFPESHREMIRRLAPALPLYQARLDHKGACLDFFDNPV